MPFEQHVYDAVAAALEQGMSVERMQVDVHGLAGMPRKAVLQLAKKVEAGGRVPVRHGVHRNHRRKVHALHVNFLLQRMRETGARVTLDWMRDQLHMYFGVQITQSGLSQALAAHNVCHKKLTQLNKGRSASTTSSSPDEYVSSNRATRARNEPTPSLISCIPVSCSKFGEKRFIPS